MGGSCFKMNKINWRFWITVFVFAFSIWSLIPSFSWYRMSEQDRETAEKAKDPIMGKSLKMGLDLRGGTQLLLEADITNLEDNISKKDAVDRVAEVVRNRIDQFGVAEPLIAKQGDKWIVVQFPGLKDPQSAKNLIGKTALLEFRIVDTSAKSSEVLDLFSKKGITAEEFRTNTEKYEDILNLLPEGASIFESKDGNVSILGKALLTGSAIANAKVDFGGQFGQPVVSIEFSKEGGTIFGNITEQNIQRNLAIVLDGIIQSAPVIKSRIPDGRAIIEGGFNSNDARLLATVLRAGALPVPVKVIEERTVGPSLGVDSIKKGFGSALVGVLAVFLFMLIYYGMSGLIADIALALNLIILLAVMAKFQFTVTLPGVAGVALTLAMAVDANVLILERIREELALGKTSRIAVDAGYNMVLATIIDSNLTTLIAAVFLFQFGTGPIKGFAVTLSIGLIISMFTAITVTKLIYDFLFKENFLLKFKI
jgi:protein-export membrane protein SecD